MYACPHANAPLKVHNKLSSFLCHISCDCTEFGVTIIIAYLGLYKFYSLKYWVSVLIGNRNYRYKLKKQVKGNVSVF